MSTQVLACSLGQFSKHKNRPLADYHPNVWGDRFNSYISEDEVVRSGKKKQLEDLKEEIRRKLMNATCNSNTSQQLKFVDAVQHLGVAYHFEREIEQVLQHIYASYPNGDDMEADIYNVALQFRLLRQAGYNVSCGVFNEFKDEKGDFRKALINYVRGMLGLYEAAHLGVEGEDILDEALAFTVTNLTCMVEHLEYPLKEQVDHALKRPIRRSLERWWKELDFTTKLPFARDRLVECYFWVLGVYFEPQYVRARRILTKIIAMTSIIDDIYDAYGIFEELELFTEAIERWDINCIDHLPEYMKLCYVALLDVYKEIEREMEKDGYQYRLHYAIEAMKKQARAYFKEAKWFHEGSIPTVEEYMSIALVSTGYSMLTITSFIGMGEIVTKEAFDWAIGDPRIISASTVICRLMDDISSHKFEQKRGHVASGIECYMKQHDVSEEVVCDKFRKEIVNGWKDINKEFLQPTDAPVPLLMRSLNLARAMDVLHKGEDGQTFVDGYTHVGKAMKNNVTSLLIDPIV